MTAEQTQAPESSEKMDIESRWFSQTAVSKVKHELDT